MILNESEDMVHFDAPFRNCWRGKNYVMVVKEENSFLPFLWMGSLFLFQSLKPPRVLDGRCISEIDVDKYAQFNGMFSVINRPVCRMCWARNLCGGGCINDALEATGEAILPNPVTCEQIKYEFELAMKMCMEIAERDESLLQRRYDLGVAQ